MLSNLASDCDFVDSVCFSRTYRGAAPDEAPRRLNVSRWFTSVTEVPKDSVVADPRLVGVSILLIYRWVVSSTGTKRFRCMGWQLLSASHPDPLHSRSFGRSIPSIVAGHRPGGSRELDMFPSDSAMETASEEDPHPISGEG